MRVCVKQIEAVVNGGSAAGELVVRTDLPRMMLRLYDVTFRAN